MESVVDVYPNDSLDEVRSRIVAALADQQASDADRELILAAYEGGVAQQIERAATLVKRGSKVEFNKRIAGDAAALVISFHPIAPSILRRIFRGL